MADGFLGRWSQRKAAVRAGVDPAEPIAPALSPVPPAAPTIAAPAPLPVPASDISQAPALAPTLEEAQALKPDSDFKPFAAHGVDPMVRNAAMKKLFSDPHFNVMDGLDTYIDDYSQPTALLAADLRMMVSAQFLKLFDEEKPDAVHPPPTVPAHAHSDLQLQQDPPAEPAGTGERAQ